MCGNLVKAGYKVRAFDLSDAAKSAAGDAGATVAASAGDAVQGADVAITMLPAGKFVIEVWSAILPAMKPGALIIDCSTIDVDSARKAHELAKARGVESLDAPVSGGVGGAKGATLAFMAGGTDTAFKRTTAVWYYRLLARMGVKIVHNHADFRLMSRRAVEALKSYSEVNLFIRGIVPLLGYRTAVVEYERAERFAGESKYPLGKMLALAFNGITSFSAAPLRFIALLGLLVSGFSGCMILYVLWVKLFTAQGVPGWASSVVPIYLIGGIQLLSIGVLGEYVSKIYFESKRRPRYFIDDSV